MPKLTFAASAKLSAKSGGSKVGHDGIQDDAFPRSASINPADVTVNDAFFAKFEEPTAIAAPEFYAVWDHRSDEAASLSSTDIALTDAKRRFIQEHESLADLAIALKAVEQRVGRQQRKVEGLENSHTLLRPDTWFTGGIAAKIEKHTKRLDAMKAEEKQLTDLKMEAAAARKQALERLETCTSLADQKRELEGEMKRMFDHVMVKLGALLTPPQQAVDPPPVAHCPSPTSHLPPPISHLPPPTSHLPRPTSRL
jgi:hypothetical protein